MCHTFIKKKVIFLLNLRLLELKINVAVFLQISKLTKNTTSYHTRLREEWHVLPAPRNKPWYNIHQIHSTIFIRHVES